MSEREKKILEALNAAIPKMSEFQKGYLLGTAESMAEKHSMELDKKAE